VNADSSHAKNPSRTGKACPPPRQARSFRTYNTLLDAAKKLLLSHPWEQISTAAITQTAGCSNGAIYGRFKTKDELLLGLYRRHNANLKEQHKQRSPVYQEGETLEQFLRRELLRLVDDLRTNRWLLREVGMLARRKPEVVDDETLGQRREMFQQISAHFENFAHELDHPDLPRGSELTIFFVTTILREALLYQGPHFRSLGLSDAELVDSLVSLSLGFLGARSKGVQA